MNVYTDPEDFGLAVLGEIDWSDGCYQFDLTVVFHDLAGIYWYAEDSGCSCPSPFDSVGLTGITRITSLAQIQQHLERRAAESAESYQGPDRSTAVADLIERLHREGLR